jgi:biotin-(acetyl-CoA carboxylase) ligase
VRWPNKVVIGPSVVATTGVARLWGAGESRAMLNLAVNRLHVDSPGSTSLEDELGVQVDDAIFVDKILESLSWMHFGWNNDMEEHVLKRVRSMTETIDRPVSATTKSGSGRGTATGIDPLGRLVVELDGGKVVKLTSADELLAQ